MCNSADASARAQAISALTAGGAAEAIACVKDFAADRHRRSDCEIYEIRQGKSPRRALARRGIGAGGAELQARRERMMENYGLNKRDARLVVAVMESLGETINLKDDEGEDSHPNELQEG
jgi:hypothetical protein